MFLNSTNQLLCHALFLVLFMELNIKEYLKMILLYFQKILLILITQNQ